ncbi:MAG: isoprenylcysteine carboxylmethyltransferase family protein, partial [Planctomycetota bacterium]
YLRHPLYVANGLSGAAALVVLGQLELLAVYSLAYLPITALIVHREEEALDRRFGDEHASYRARVPAFCPLPGRSQPRETRQGSFAWAPVHRSLELLKLAVILGASAWVILR